MRSFYDGILPLLIVCHKNSYVITVFTTTYLLTWILEVASKQLRMLHGPVGDSTTSLNSLSPQMSELV